jgi:ABC-type antimicrobial peptide transport system permease subunit
MAEGLEWFSSQSPWRQIFVGLFVVFIALPILTLTVLQFFESLRSSRESRRNYGKSQGKDGK